MPSRSRLFGLSTRHFDRSPKGRLLVYFLFFAAMASWAWCVAAAVPPEARVAPQPGNPLEIRFEATAGEGGGVHTWHFGDGASATGAIVSHVYAAPGNYRVSLEIDDGVSVTTLGFWQVAGDLLASLDFESGLPAGGWMSSGMSASPEGAIEGEKGVLAWIVNPNPAPSCAMPIEVPPDQLPREDRPRRWLLSALVDLGSAPPVEDAAFDVLRIFDDSVVSPIFAAGFEAGEGKWYVRASAADGASGLSPSTTKRAVEAEALLVELEAQIGHDVASSGHARLRVLSWPDGEQVVAETLSGLSNALYELDSFDFGFFDPSFPAIVDPGELKLDDFRVVTDTCLGPSAEALEGYWDFEDPAQPGLDLSGRGRHGTAMAGASTIAGRSRPDGTAEKALELDGAGYLEISNLGLDLVGATQVSVEAWVKVASHPQLNLLRARQPLAVRSSALAVSNYIEGNGWVSLSASPEPPVGTWYHLATVFDHGAAKIFVNGQLAAEQTLAFTALDGVSYSHWAIGARVPGAGAAADQHFIGQVDDVKIYSRALGVAEIQAAAGLCP